MRWLLLLLLFYGVDAHGFVIGTKAKQAIAFDMTSNTVLFSKNADNPMHPLSMTNVMVLYIASGYIKTGIITMDDLFAASEYAWKQIKPSLFLKHGQLVKVRDLMESIAILSANDATVTLAEGISGSEESFINEMNLAAKKIGMKNTKFTNISSSAYTNTTTMQDMVRLSVRLLHDYPEHYHLLSESKIRFNNIQQRNNNKLLSSENSIDGIKSWYSQNDGYGVLLSTIRSGRRIIIGVNGLKTENERSVEARKILLYALNNFDSKKIVKKGQQLGTISIWNGKKKELPIIADSDVTISFERSSHKKVSVKLVHDNFIKAPITKHQKIAELKISSPELPDRIVPIYSTEDIVEVGKFEKFVNKVFNRNK